MTINPLRPSGPPIPPVGPGQVGATPAPVSAPASAAAEFGRQLVAGTTPTPQNNPLDRATYDRISRKIKEAAAAGKSSQEILGVLVEDELTTALGQAPSPALLASVREQFQTSPQLKDLFSKLHRKTLG